VYSNVIASNLNDDTFLFGFIFNYIILTFIQLK